MKRLKCNLVIQIYMYFVIRSEMKKSKVTRIDRPDSANNDIIHFLFLIGKRISLKINTIHFSDILNRLERIQCYKF